MAEMTNPDNHGPSGSKPGKQKTEVSALAIGQSVSKWFENRGNIEPHEMFKQLRQALGPDSEKLLERQLVEHARAIDHLFKNRGTLDSATFERLMRGLTSPEAYKKYETSNVDRALEIGKNVTALVDQRGNLGEANFIGRLRETMGSSAEGRQGGTLVNLAVDIHRLFKNIGNLERNQLGNSIATLIGSFDSLDKTSPVPWQAESIAPSKLTRITEFLRGCMDKAGIKIQQLANGATQDLSPRAVFFRAQQVEALVDSRANMTSAQFIAKVSALYDAKFGKLANADLEYNAVAVWRIMKNQGNIRRDDMHESLKQHLGLRP